MTVKWNPDFETSSLSRTVTRDGLTAKVSIVRMVGTTNWFMTVTDAANEKDEAEPIWEDPFATDEEAYAEFEQTVAEEGMHSLLYGWKSIPLLQRRDKEPNLDFVTSSLSRTVTRDGITLKVNIIQIVGETGWLLEVFDPQGKPTTINYLYATDEEAYAAFEQTVAEEGMRDVSPHLLGSRRSRPSPLAGPMSGSG